eukprot:3936094-Rhodomonas_salina.1
MPPFTMNEHSKIGCFNIAMLPVFIITAYISTSTPHVTIVTADVLDHLQFSLKNKLKWLHNHSESIARNGSSTQIPKQLVFTQHRTDMYAPL